MVPFIVSWNPHYPLHFLLSLFTQSNPLESNPLESNPFDMASWDDTLKRRLEFAALHKEAIDADREQAGYNGFNIFWHSAQMFSKTITSRYTNRNSNGQSNPIELYECDLRELW
jgi:hypothetical protein